MMTSTPAPNLISTIETGRNHLTVVNLLAPPIEKQAALVTLLQQGITEEMSHRPGFISANIHRSLDSNHVLVYAQWESSEALQGAVAALERGETPNMISAFKLGNPQYHPYEVVSIHQAAL
ncbi:MAG: antibiotic biosynthesis monooxygenase family protein [Cyanobacteria bacterium J06635_1]